MVPSDDRMVGIGASSNRQRNVDCRSLAGEPGWLAHSAQSGKRRVRRKRGVEPHAALCRRGPLSIDHLIRFKKLIHRSRH